MYLRTGDKRPIVRLFLENKASRPGHNFLGIILSRNFSQLRQVGSIDGRQTVTAECVVCVRVEIRKILSLSLSRSNNSSFGFSNSVVEDGIAQSDGPGEVEVERGKEVGVREGCGSLIR